MTPAAAVLIAGTALFGAVPAASAETERSHAQIPEWVSAPPAEAQGRVYFVGVRSGARSLEEGLEGATEGAQQQMAGYIRMRPDGRFSSRLGETGNRVVDEVRTSKSAVVEGGVQEGIYWVSREVARGERSWEVWVLMSFPAAYAVSERRRLSEAESDSVRAYKAICDALSPSVSGRSLTFEVSGFKDRASGGRYGLSRVIEGELRACLLRAGAKSEESRRADILVTGEHWVSPRRVTVEARVCSGASRAVLKSALASFPREAVESSWLNEDVDPGDELLAAPGKARRPQAKGGSLRVESTPPGARIILDGEDRGRTPMTLHRLPAGTYSLILRLEGYVPQARESIVRAGERSVLDAALEQMTGSLRIVTDPAGAAVTMNGEERGISPVHLKNLPIGSYAVSLRLDDHHAVDDVAAVEYGRETRFERKLKAEPGALVVYVTPPEAEVRVDGLLVGNTADRALRFEGIAAGWRTVRVEKEGFSPEEWRVDVRSNQSASVTGVLRRADRVVRPPREPWRMPRLAFERPGRLVYLNTLGGSVGSGGAGVRLLEGRTYAFGFLGIGTSLAAFHRAGFTSRRQKTTVSAGIPRTSSQDMRVTFTSIFPVRLSLAPLAHAYSFNGRRTAAVLEVFGEGCFWAKPTMPDSGLPDSTELPTSRVFDFGVLLHAGLGAGLRAGVLKARMPSFSIGNDRFSGVDETRPYVAVQFDLGGFFVQD